LLSQIEILEELQITNSDPAILEEIGGRIVDFESDIVEA
jgi:hypothetical protein